jgi:3-hydroxyacyl-CoA dehydrogenase
MVRDIRALLAIVKEKYDALVIGNENKQFAVGANIREIVDLMEEKKVKELDIATANFQNMNMDIKFMGKPVVIAPFNMVLGGGMEMCLHSTQIIANAETYMGLVEVGVGLVPSGGGCKEMVIRASDWAAAAAGGDSLPFLKMIWESISTAKVTGSAFDGYDLAYMRGNDVVNMDRITQLKEAKTLALTLTETFRPKQPGLSKVLGQTGVAALQMIIDYMKEGKWISEHDGLIAEKVAYILSGGNVAAGSMVSEQYLLDLEREAFLFLAGTAKTQDRITHMLKGGKPLRN